MSRTKSRPKLAQVLLWANFIAVAIIASGVGNVSNLAGVAANIAGFAVLWGASA